MAKSQLRSKRKSTGSRYKDTRKKKQRELGNVATLPKIGAASKRTDRVMGAHVKTRILNHDIINLIDPKTKKAVKAKLKSVSENPANRNFVRRNILTKGTIVETEKGKAKITSRPGQEGTINGVLLS